MKNVLILGGAILCLLLSACVTTPTPSDPAPETGSDPSTNTEAPPVITTQPEITPPPASTTETMPPPVIDSFPGQTGQTQPPIISKDISTAYADITGWDRADFSKALMSFQRGCAKIIEKTPTDAMSSDQPKFGTASDWMAACSIALATPQTGSDGARRFFESEFLPVVFTPEETGMVTGYYQPEIQTRRYPTGPFTEPILAVPTNAASTTLPRSRITASTSDVLGYGRPIDVFFMQIQGSGVMVFDDGQKMRAAYAANNGYPYTSIGSVLISRGEMTKDQSSKDHIENWMIQAGPEKARALMNENKRYIFFRAETILPGEGPKGAMRVPLTDMASIAVDPSYYPYGLPVWLELKVPTAAGDYRGSQTELLVIAQDTGKAIRGANRADLYFGSGDSAGEKAGVMKHPARWTILLPFHLALQLASRT